MSSQSDRPTKSSTTAVVGLQYGDEGKGQIVDLLSADHNIVVRYNGGANAGHSVSIGNERFVLHQIPIGILRPGRINVLAGGVVVSVAELAREMRELSQAGVDLSGLKVSDRAHVVMPYHLIEEQYRHRIAASMLGEEHTLGTTNKGIGPCYSDKAARDTAIRTGDLLARESLRDRLAYIVAVKNATLAGLAEVLDEQPIQFEVQTLYDQCREWGRLLDGAVCDTAAWLADEIQSGRRVLFEGANSAMLDIDFGTYPYVTSSNGSTLGISAGTGLAPSFIGHRIGVAKSYMSRVGTGPFVTEIEGGNADRIREIGAEYGSTTARPRRIGWLDLVALKRMVVHNDIDGLVMTGLSVLASLDSFRVCTGYTLDGETNPEWTASAEVMARMEPVYREFSARGAELDGASLPDWAQQLIQLISEHVTEVMAVCIGKRRDQVIWLKPNQAQKASR